MTKEKKNKYTTLKLALIIGILAFLQYANTLEHGYTWEDFNVITNNGYVQKGLTGIDEIWSKPIFSLDKEVYRPISHTSFALEVHFFGNDPSVGHFINVLLFALCSILLLITLLEIFEDYPTVFIVLIVLLFIVHPIHTEVVANIKNREELFAALFSIGSILLFWKFLISRRALFILSSIFLLLLGILSIPSTAAILFLYPVLYVYFVRKDYEEKAKEEGGGKKKILTPEEYETPSPLWEILPIGTVLALVLVNLSLGTSVYYQLGFISTLLIFTFLIFLCITQSKEASVWLFTFANISIIIIAILFWSQYVLIIATAFYLIYAHLYERWEKQFLLKVITPLILPLFVISFGGGMLTLLFILVFWSMQSSIQEAPYVIIFSINVAACLVNDDISIPGGLLIMAFLFGAIDLMQNKKLPKNKLIVAAFMVFAIPFVVKDNITAKPLDRGIKELPIRTISHYISPDLDTTSSKQINKIKQLPRSNREQTLENPVSVLNNSLVGTVHTSNRLFPTIASIQLKYLGKLFYPYPLVHHYGYKSIPDSAWGDWKPWLSFIFHLIIFVAAIIQIFKGNPIALGIWIYAITILPYSNLFYLAPHTMAERFLFMPSIGFCIAFVFTGVGLFNINFWKQRDLRAFVTIMAIILLVLSWRTIERNQDWQDNLTLIQETLPYNQSNVVLRVAYANELRKVLAETSDPEKREDLQNKIIRAFERAINSYPSFINAQLDFGRFYMEMGEVEKGIEVFKKAAINNPNDPMPLFYQGLGFHTIEEWEKAIIAFSACLEEEQFLRSPLTRKDRKKAISLLSDCFIKNGEPEKADALNQKMESN